MTLGAPKLSAPRPTTSRQSFDFPCEAQGEYWRSTEKRLPDGAITGGSKLSWELGNRQFGGNDRAEPLDGICRHNAQTRGQCKSRKRKNSASPVLWSTSLQTSTTFIPPKVEVCSVFLRAFERVLSTGDWNLVTSCRAGFR